jgi:hypothetical protein
MAADGAYVVYYVSKGSGERLYFPDRLTACAEFIVREVESLAEYLKPESPLIG